MIYMYCFLKSSAVINIPLTDNPPRAIKKGKAGDKSDVVI